jgi:hypothetical protein
MTATHPIPSTVLVAIDISKHRHEVLIGVPGKKRHRRMTIMNTLEDFQRLSAALVGYDLPVRIGFEATGNHHRPLAHPQQRTPKIGQALPRARTGVPARERASGHRR